MNKESNPKPGPDQIKPTAPQGPPRAEPECSKELPISVACGICFLSCMRSESGCFKKDFDRIQTELDRLKEENTRLTTELEVIREECTCEECEQSFNDKDTGITALCMLCWNKMIRKLRKEIDRLKERMDAAEAYIKASPIDPDITEKQRQAYRKWQALIAKGD